MSLTRITEQEIEEFAELFPICAIHATLKGMIKATDYSDDRIIHKITLALKVVRREIATKEQEENT